MTLIESFLENSPVEDLEKLLEVYIDIKSQDRYECDSIDEASDPRRLFRTHIYSTCEVDSPPNVNNKKQQQLIEIAHQLKSIASDFHLERKGLDDRLEGLTPDEISVIREIFTLHQPSVADIADIVLKNLTPGTLGFTLDLLIQNTNDRQSQIGLPFDLIGAMYVMKGALNIPSWGDLGKLLDVYIDVKNEYQITQSICFYSQTPRECNSTFENEHAMITNDENGQLIEIARQLNNFASTFNLHFKDSDDLLEAGLNPDELSVIREIFTLQHPTVSDIADIILKKLTPATLNFTLDLLIKTASDRQSQIGLPFDLIGVMYVMMGAVNIPSFVKTCCLQRINELI